jgi:mono/diheme cytochrome c family protein
MNKILVSPMQSIIKLIPLAMLVACGSPNPQLSGLTPIPSLAPGATQTPLAALQAASVQTLLPTMLPPKDDGAAIGAHLFVENCSPCHGNQGQGVDAPNLRNSDYVKTAGDQALYETIALGRSGTEMPAWLQENGGPLTDPQIGEIVAYLHTLQGVSSLPPVSPPPEEPAPTPLPAGAPTPEPAQPSNPGSTGPAVNLSGDVTQGMASFGPYCAPCHGPQGVQGIPNPGSDDGSVPAINPIDPTIVNQDANIFAANLDLFIEHGSVPEGSNPRLVMPSFGDSQMLTPQQISDLIAYIISLNGVPGD